MILATQGWLLVVNLVTYSGLYHKPFLFIGESDHIRVILCYTFLFIFNFSREIALEMFVWKMLSRDNHACNDENTNVYFEECLSSFISNQLNCTLFWTNQTGTEYQ